MQDALASVERIERESKEAKENVMADTGRDPIEVETEVETSAEPETGNDGGSEEAQAAPVEEGEGAGDEPQTDGEAVLREQLLRLAADFENFRKRARREQDELRKFGVEGVAKAMLPVADNLERALKHTGGKDDDPFVQGVAMVAKQFADVLATFGVQGFDSMGEAFNPERHEAMGQVPSGDVEPGTIVEEMERGYFLHERLLRPAKVIVAAALPDDQET